jgi:hypothetical protein
MTTSPSPHLQSEQEALLAVLGRLLEPMASLCLAKGVSIQAVEETLRKTFVDVARQACAELNSTRIQSRVSTMTGLTRREVSRLLASQAPARPAGRSAATDLLGEWTTHPLYLNAQVAPKALPRTGVAPSFEALAASTTQDVHARTLLAEMQRLGLAEHDESSDTVSLTRDIFVPVSDWPRMMGFLGDNVGDHMQAAVENVLGDGRRHFEQSLLADEMSEESLEQAKDLITQQWREVLQRMGPQLQGLMNEDRLQGRRQDRQLRIGMYSHMAPMPTSTDQDNELGEDHAQSC